MLISVIVTTYNRPDALRALISGLAAQDVRGVEIIVADDGSRDDAKSSHMWLHHGADPAYLADDRGPAPARHAAAHDEHREYLLF
jgi:hypothetical protein